MRRRLPLAAVVAAGFVLLASCGVQVDSSIGADRKATVQVQASFHPVLQAYLDDLTGGKTAEVVNADRIKARLAEEPGVTVKSLEASVKNGVRMSLEVADLQRLLSAKDSVVKGIIALSAAGGATKLTVKLDRKAVESLMSLGMEKNDQSLRYLLPQNAATTADKYRENLRWALEEYGSAAQLDDLFKSAAITLRLTVPGPVKSSSGFTVTDKVAGKLQLTISLLDLLTLQAPRSYELSY
jgi:hypothetical protein